MGKKRLIIASLVSVAALTILVLILINIFDNKSHANTTGFDRDLLADQVKDEFIWSWNSYKQFAWGADELKSVTGEPHNWYGESLGITPIDALDALIIMGFKEEAKRVRNYIADSISWDKDIFVSNFEITIRCLGGLISAYQLSEDERLLEKAEDLGRRLLPAFNSPTGMPYRFVNLRTGATKDAQSNPAEIGSLILEFGTLSKLTGDPVFYDKAKNAMMALFSKRSVIGLPGTGINIETGSWTDGNSHIGCCIDSYFEYALKSFLLFGDPDFKIMWDTHIQAINQHCAFHVEDELWYGKVSMQSGRPYSFTTGALDAYFPAVLALGGQVQKAEAFQNSLYKMWDLYDLEPENMDFIEMSLIEEGYALRPEIIESAYYLYHYTKDPKYLEMAKKFWEDIFQYCRTDYGYTTITSVISKEKGNLMHSFFLSETLKYFYLIFSEDEPIDFEQVIFTTEAHPIKKEKDYKQGNF